ncbi:MAG: TetR/AcrR family transcriptional regulator [Sedimentisphaerales bacterium]
MDQNADFQVKSEVSAKDVRNRLLDVAEKLFSERGFADTSVRDITAAANCNVAAVNYHFGSKDKLYIEMFRRHMEKVFAKHKANIEKVMSSANPTLEKLLEAITKTALEALAGADERIPMLKLMVRESLNPQLKEKLISLDILKDFLNQICEALMRLFPKLTQRQAMLCVYAIEGMVIHPMLFYDDYNELFFAVPVDELVKHIARFTAAGVREAAGYKQISE